MADRSTQNVPARLWRKLFGAGGRPPSEPSSGSVDEWTPDELRREYRRQQTALQQMSAQMRQLRNSKDKLRDELRMYRDVGVVAGSAVPQGQVQLIDDSDARKELARVLSRSGLHTWAPREVWGAEADERFEEIVAPLIESRRTLLGRDRLYTLWQAVRNLGAVEGCVAEVGVYRGGSVAFLSQAFATQNREAPVFYAIDTFEGHQPDDIEAFELQKPRDFADTDFAEVRRFLAAFPRLDVFKGAFAEVAPRLPEARYALVHLDVDLYRPTAAALEYFAARLQPRGVIVVDDYMAPQCVGVTRAVQEFVSRRTDFQAWCLMTEQVVLVRLDAVRPA